MGLRPYVMPAIQHAALSAAVWSYQRDDARRGIAEINGEVVETLVAILKPKFGDKHSLNLY